MYDVYCDYYSYCTEGPTVAKTVIYEWTGAKIPYQRLSYILLLLVYRLYYYYHCYDMLQYIRHNRCLGYKLLFAKIILSHQRYSVVSVVSAVSPQCLCRLHKHTQTRSAPLIAFGRISLASNIYVCVFIVFVVSLHEPQKLIPKL